MSNELKKYLSDVVNGVKSKVKPFLSKASSLKFDSSTSLSDLKKISKQLEKNLYDAEKTANREAHNFIEKALKQAEADGIAINKNKAAFNKDFMYFWDMLWDEHLDDMFEKISSYYYDCLDMIKQVEKQGGKKAYTHSDTKAESKEYAEFQAHKIVSAAFDKVFRR